MLSQQELYNEAMRKISARRQMARTLADELQAELEASYPRLAVANANLRSAGIAAALAGAKGEDTTEAKAAIATAKAAVDTALAELGRSTDALLPKFTCNICNDTGLTDGKVCACIRTLMRSMRRKEIEATTALSITRFEDMKCSYYPNKRDAVTGLNLREYMKELLADLQEYALDFDLRSSNLLLFGNSGLGKTHAALAIAGIVLEKGYDVIYISSPDFFSKLESYHFNGDTAQEAAFLRSVTNADLLILDDLGTELVSSFIISTFYTLLNNRTAAGTPTIFTSNIIDSALFEKRYTEKIASRLSGTCEPFQFIGDDIRAIKAMEA